MIIKSAGPGLKSGRAWPYRRRYNLGTIYSRGIKDPVRAAFWFELAGQDGSVEDKYTLGVMYSKGEPLEE